MICLAVNTNNKAFTNWWGASIYGGFPGQVSYGYPGQGDYGGYPSQGDYGGYPRYPGQGDYGGHPGYPGQGGYGGYPEYPGQGGYGGNCYFGCCRLNYYGLGCERCCNYFGEPLDAETEARPHN